MYIYSNHEDNSLYINNEELKHDQLYCDICCDYDEFIGEFNTTLQAKEILSNLINERCYNKEYIERFFKEEVLPYFEVKKNILKP